MEKKTTAVITFFKQYNIAKVDSCLPQFMSLQAIMRDFVTSRPGDLTSGIYSSSDEIFELFTNAEADYSVFWQPLYEPYDYYT